MEKSVLLEVISRYSVIAELATASDGWVIVYVSLSQHHEPILCLYTKFLSCRHPTSHRIASHRSCTAN